MNRKQMIGSNSWNNGTTAEVGWFCEYLAQNMFGGEIVHDDTADITIWSKSGEGIGLEVKGAGVPHFHVMREEQLDEHLRALDFPLKHSCFLLFYYKNKRVVVEGKRKKESTQLRLCGDRYTRRQHMATNMFGLDVIDTRLVAKWRDEKTLCQYPSDRSKKTPVFRTP